MTWIKRISVTVALLTVIALSGGVATATGGNSQWNSAGGNRENTRFQSTENKLDVTNVAGLVPKWVVTTGGDVSATPAVDGTSVYVPDWAGNLYAVDKVTGQVIWQVSIPAVTGVTGDKARATPALTDDKLIIGTQGAFGGGGKVLAFDKRTGALLWSTTADDHPFAIITQSATIFGGFVYVVVASLEEAIAASPGYPCCSFRGSMLAIDVDTGAIVWKTYMAPEGFSGNAVWGSSPAIDTKRRQLYVATGNNYSVPPDVLACVAAAGDVPDLQRACMPADNHFDSIMAIDLKTGAVKWATRAVPFDAWTTDCIPFLGDGSNCPEPAGPDYDFGQAPALFTVKSKGSGPSRQLVGAGQKSGQYWALDPASGAVVWVTQAGPGGTAGGLQWGSAVDGRRIYTANANSLAEPWTLPDSTVVNSGVWSALDAATGQILWQTSPSNSPTQAPGVPVSLFGDTPGPVTTANGVVFGCSMEGHMYALNGATGAELWSFDSGGSCISGAAISNGRVYWGSGYSNFGGGTPNNKLYAFGLAD